MAAPIWWESRRLLGDPVYSATPLTLKQVLPTLPPPGVAASVNIEQILQGQILHQVQDPESMLLPENEWPEVMPTAKTQMEDMGEYP